MGKHIYKQGLRKCCYCKNILLLNKSNFYSSKNKPMGFRYECKPCMIEANNRDRLEFIKSRDNKCEKCGLQNLHPSFFDVDHIKPILRRTNKITSDDFSKKEIRNLMVLCPNCHRIKTIQNKEFTVIHRST